MVQAGLVDEVRELLGSGYDERAPGMNATGYVEMLPHVRAEYDLATAVDAIQRATRRYARRQHTWFRHQLPDNAVKLDARQDVHSLVEQITRA
jgi:tRNA dimethylallyltransferase